MLSIVTKGYRLRFTSPRDFPVGDTVPTGTRQDSRHEGTDIPNAPKERDNRGASRFPRLLLERIPGTQSFRRMASSHRFKRTERSHLCTFIFVCSL